MTTQRLSRKEIKHDVREDAFRQGVEQTYGYVLGHRRMLLLGLVGLLALVAAVVGFVLWRQRREQGADEQLARAVRTFDAPIVATGAAPDDPSAPSYPDETSRRDRARQQFESVQKAYSGTGAADVAAVYLARIHMLQGDEAKARALWEEFLDDHRDHILAGAVRVSLIDLDRAEGKGEQVVARLRADLEKDDKPLPGDVLLFQLGQTLEQLGRKDEARTAYQRIAEEHPDSPYAGRAQMRIRELAPGDPSSMLTIGE